jgi:hypothetical protein
LLPVTPIPKVKGLISQYLVTGACKTIALAKREWMEKTVSSEERENDQVERCSAARQWRWISS